MGRALAPIDPRSPLAEFASGLRALKHASNLTYQQMGKEICFSVPALSAAASGKSLPTLEVTLAYVRACVGAQNFAAFADVWTDQWEQARDDLRGGSHA
jgi:transcriptional regulator with XRE-family HTH domain